MIYDYKGREIHINDELLEKYKRNVYTDITVPAINYFIGIEKGLDTEEEVDNALSTISDAELNKIVKNRMLRQIKIMS